MNPNFLPSNVAAANYGVDPTWPKRSTRLLKGVKGVYNCISVHVEKFISLSTSPKHLIVWKPVTPERDDWQPDAL